MEKRLIPAALAALLALCGCSGDNDSHGGDLRFTVARMQALCLSADAEGSHFGWRELRDADADTLVGSECDLFVVKTTPGSYRYALDYTDATGSRREKLYTVTVVHESGQYSPYIDRVTDYSPAPGQFVNLMPLYDEGDTREEMRRKAQECIAGSEGGLITLGGFGGSVTFAFDHVVCNLPGQYDFRLWGNTFSNGLAGSGNAEPGIVQVAFDRNGNGLPDDDEWYELAGSAHDSCATRRHYRVTYYAPDEGHQPQPQGNFTDLCHIRWADNGGDTGYMAQNRYHTQSYFPAWEQAGSLTFAGTRLPDNVIDESGTGEYYVGYSFAWGYADNQPNSEADLNSFDIGWAVDSEGRPVQLPGAHFIRVYTALHQQCGWIGESSTELMKGQDLHL